MLGAGGRRLSPGAGALRGGERVARGSGGLRPNPDWIGRGEEGVAAWGGEWGGFGWGLGLVGGDKGGVGGGRLGRGVGRSAGLVACWAGAQWVAPLFFYLFSLLFLIHSKILRQFLKCVDYTIITSAIFCNPRTFLF